jgi:hypothetical protein
MSQAVSESRKTGVPSLHCTNRPLADRCSVLSGVSASSGTATTKQIATTAPAMTALSTAGQRRDGRLPGPIVEPPAWDEVAACSGGSHGDRALWTCPHGGGGAGHAGLPVGRENA